MDTRVGRFLPGELHTHTFLSDGSHSLEEVLDNAFNKFQLNWLVVTDHGGGFNRDTTGALYKELGVKIRGEEYGKKGYMWRSQSIIDYGEPEIERLRKVYKNKLILHGLEFNLAFKGHAGVMITEDASNSLAKFEYIYDYLDHDETLGLEKHNKSPQDTLKAVRYLQENFPDNSFFIINHPHVYKAFTPRFIRELNDAAPDVVNGFEGFPGHQWRKERGCYLYENGDDYRFYRTYGGADYMLSKVGGLWDSLLGEGRRFFVFGGSDFHTYGKDLDPFPGEYNKTFLYFDRLEPKELVKSVKNGKAFVVSGNIIEDLDFNLESKEQKAGLGEELYINNRKIVIDINVKTEGDSLNHIDVIEGEVGERYSPESQKYDSGINLSTRVLLRIYKEDMVEVRPGYYRYKGEYQATFPKGYLRLRGTNLPLNTENETDKDSNPLMDNPLTQPNTKEIALKDCWFYSNPIFYFCE